MIKAFVLSAPNRLINIEANYINVLLSLLLRDERFHFINNSRINVMLSDKYKDEINVKGTNDSVCNIQIQQPNFDNYINLNKEERKKWQIETAYNALKELFIVKKWEVSTLQELRVDLLDRMNTMAIPMYKKNKKSKSYSVMLSLIPDLDKNIFCATFFDNGNKIWNVNFFEGYPLFLFWKRFFSSSNWVSDKVFKITDAKNEFSFTFDVLKKQYSIEIEPSSTDKAKTLDFINSWRSTSEKPYFADL